MHPSWQEFSASEFCESVRDGTHDSPKFHAAGHPLVTSKAIKDGQLILENAGLISERDFLEINKRSKVDQWDVLFTMIGTLGEVYLEKSEDISYAIKNIGLFKCGSELKARWLYYWFRSPEVKARLLQFRRGASQQYLPLGTLRSLPIRFPDSPTLAYRIVQAVSAYDDLIESNRRRIALLEEAARQLYKEWFVRFRFPGHEHVKIIDGVPEGWERRAIGDLTTKLGSGATPRGGSASYQDTGITLIRSQNVYDFRFDDDGLVHITDDQADKLANVIVQPDDILLNITGASVARCCLVPERHLPARVNQHVMIVRVEKDICQPNFLLHSINSNQNKEGLLSIARAGGATREALTKDIVAGFEIWMPPRALISEFEEMALPMAGQAHNLSTLNVNLAKARDLLLPKLMSGAMTV